MPTHAYMSPEPPLRAAFAPVKGVRTASIDAAEPRRPALSPVRLAEIGLVAFTGAAGIWCLIEAVRFFTS
jgi:hypothetical protein